MDYQGDLDSDHKQDNSGKSSPEGNQYDSRVKYKTQKMSTLQQTMEEETTCIFQQMQNSELSGRTMTDFNLLLSSTEDSIWITG